MLSRSLNSSLDRSFHFGDVDLVHLHHCTHRFFGLGAIFATLRNYDQQTQRFSTILRKLACEIFFFRDCRRVWRILINENRIGNGSE